MLGFLIAAIAFVVNNLFFKTLPESISSAGHFLYIWNWVFAGLNVALSVCFSLGLINLTVNSTDADAAKEATKAIKNMLRIGSGGVMSKINFIKMLIRNTLSIIGAYLITLSGTASMTFDQFDKTKLFVGLAIVGVALFLSKKKVVGVVMINDRETA